MASGSGGSKKGGSKLKGSTAASRRRGASRKSPRAKVDRNGYVIPDSDLPF